jgi:hypothetical protein
VPLPAALQRDSEFSGNLRQTEPTFGQYIGRASKPNGGRRFRFLQMELEAWELATEKADASD